MNARHCVKDTAVIHYLTVGGDLNVRFLFLVKQEILELLLLKYILIEVYLVCSVVLVVL